MQCQVLVGTGGVGKTQLAADYANAFWEDCTLDVLVWITASTRSAAVTGYAQAGVELVCADPADPEQAARQFLAWLTPKGAARPCRWLVVLDDVADPADLHELWPPTVANGHTVITTRRRDAAVAGRGRLVEVGVFTEAEALAYLTDTLAVHARTELVDQLAALAHDLGHLPLALSQAAAYLTDSGLGCAAYRRELADRTRALADLLPEPGALPDDQPTPVTAAWSMSIDRAESLRPAGLARPMLELASMLDPNGVPASVLTSPPALHHLTSCRADAGTRRSTGPRQGIDHAEVTVEEAEMALRVLHRLSLADHTPGTPHQAARVHQLIQRTVRDQVPVTRRAALVRIAADALTAAWPGLERDTGHAQALRANAAALAEHAGEALYRPDTHVVLYRAGTSLGQTGQVTAARDYYRNLTGTTRRYLGADHPDTLRSRSQLAWWQGEAGDAAGAAAAFAELLQDQLRVLEPDHPDTLRTRHNLAEWRGEAGDAAGATTAFAELLRDQLRALGPEHPDTFTTRHNLAWWRGRLGDPAGAAAAFCELLQDQLRVLGRWHPHTLRTRNNLAWWRGETGDAAGAVAEFADILQDRRRMLGPLHPDTLRTRHNLAWWRGRLGDPAGAAAAFADILRDRLRVLGPDHPDTLRTRGHLAWWRGETGDVAGAAAATAELLEDQLRVLGPDHPHTLRTRGQLARWRGETGDVAGAVAATAELLQDQLRVLGADHADTLVTVQNLARWQRDGGHAASADGGR
ncbi:tetratricopeptide repeat protein [Streptomyces actinomycinicus]|uniref:tetratricopeptide repeat protein n=1 Tax=Streptomyces actinomycinicus TaxID=1695166 RepID=UPI0027DA19E4|nr:tetratricopeptide repeat protein [Streptomyces actinomycinicus]